LTLALNLTFSPGEKEQQSHVFGFADDLPANSVTQISKETANGFSFSVGRSAGKRGRDARDEQTDSPSPWGDPREN
jgi:hypothetical protein